MGYSGAPQCSTTPIPQVKKNLHNVLASLEDALASNLFYIEDTRDAITSRNHPLSRFVDIANEFLHLSFPLRPTSSQSLSLIPNINNYHRNQSPSPLSIISSGRPPPSPTHPEVKGEESIERMRESCRLARSGSQATLPQFFFLK